MASAEYRIESTHPLGGRLPNPAGERQVLVGDRSLAVAIAAKGLPPSADGEVRVVYVPTGEVVFCKRASPGDPFDD